MSIPHLEFYQSRDTDGNCSQGKLIVHVCNLNVQTVNTGFCTEINRASLLIDSTQFVIEWAASKRDDKKATMLVEIGYS